MVSSILFARFYVTTLKDYRVPVEKAERGGAVTRSECGVEFRYDSDNPGGV